MFSLFYLIDRLSISVGQLNADPDLKWGAGLFVAGVAGNSLTNALIVAGAI